MCAEVDHAVCFVPGGGGGRGVREREKMRERENEGLMYIGR